MNTRVRSAVTAMFLISFLRKAFIKTESQTLRVDCYYTIDLKTLKQYMAYNVSELAKYTRQKEKRTTTIFPLRYPFNIKMLIVMKYSFLIKYY